MKTRVIAATEFKAKCLGLLDEIADGRITVIVTKRGRAIATIGPASTPALKSPKGKLAGKVHLSGNLLTADHMDLWEALRRP